MSSLAFRATRPNPQFRNALHGAHSARLTGQKLRGCGVLPGRPPRDGGSCGLGVRLLCTVIAPATSLRDGAPGGMRRCLRRPPCRPWKKADVEGFGDAAMVERAPATPRQLQSDILASFMLLLTKRNHRAGFRDARIRRRIGIPPATEIYHDTHLYEREMRAANAATHRSRAIWRGRDGRCPAQAVLRAGFNKGITDPAKCSQDPSSGRKTSAAGSQRSWGFRRHAHVPDRVPP